MSPLARQVALSARNHRKTDRLDVKWLARLGRLDPELLAPARPRYSPDAQHDLSPDLGDWTG